MYDANNYRSYCLGIKAVNEVCKHIVYILLDIIVFFYRWFYNARDHGSLMPTPDSKALSGNVSLVSATQYI